MPTLLREGGEAVGAFCGLTRVVSLQPYQTLNTIIKAVNTIKKRVAGALAADRAVGAVPA